MNKYLLFLTFITITPNLISMELTFGNMTYEQWESHGNSPLHTAILNKENDKALVLIKAKKHLNDRSFFSLRTPLMCASIKDNYEIIRALVDAGAEIKSQDYEGKFAWQFLRYGAPPDVMEKIHVNPHDGCEYCGCNEDDEYY